MSEVATNDSPLRFGGGLERGGKRNDFGPKWAKIYQVSLNKTYSMIHSSLYIDIYWTFDKFKCLAYINIVRKGFPDLLEIVKNGTALAGAAGKEGVQVVHCHKIILRQFTTGQTLHNLFTNNNINPVRNK